MEENLYIVLSSEKCAPCQFLKRYLTQNNIKFKVVDVNNPEHKEDMEKLRAISNHRVIPQVFKKEGDTVEFLFKGFNQEKVKTL